MELPCRLDLVQRRHSCSGNSQVSTGTDDAVWELRSNFLQLGPAAPLVSEQVEGVPGALLIPGLLTSFECHVFVRMLEQIGFTDGESTVSLSPNRHNEVCILVVPQEMGAELCRRIGPYIARSGAGGNCRCKQDFINVCFRCYKYKWSKGATSDLDEAHFFGPHFDSKQYPVSIIDGCLMEDSICSARESQMSLLLYLTDGHSGGETAFHPKDGSGETGSTVRVAPLSGAGLCFWHGDHLLSPLHEGSALTDADGAGAVAPKYIIRTDVFFDLDET